MSSPSPEGPTREKPQLQEPAVVQIDSECLRSALKEFFDPLRTNDSRTDFFAMYRRESGEFDREYATKFDEDLNTSLIFAGLFSAVSSAFIIDVQSKLEPDPNDMTAAYMRILIHTMNNTLFPDADADSATWTGPPPEIVTVQALLYASLATSLFASFFAMLGKQWISQYLRNHGGSAADKSRDRQRKLDGFEDWRFHLAIESLPVILQVALVLLGFALSKYLWTISRTVAGVIVAVTLFGLTLYVFLTLAATLYCNCPYQTPPSILIRTLIKYVTSRDTKFTRSIRSVVAPLPPINNLGRALWRLRSGVRSALESFGRIPAVAEESEHIPLAIVVAGSPTQFLEEISVDWEVYKADARCISWVLYSTTDADVIFSTVRFAADMVWYPEIVGALSPHVLAELFFDCLLDGEVIPGKSEHASSIGLALASVLSVYLCTDPENQALRELCERIDDQVDWELSSGPTLMSVTAILRFIATTPASAEELDLTNITPNQLPTTYWLWWSRIMLQTVWRWRCAHEPTRVLALPGMVFVCRGFAADDDQVPVILKTNCFLIMAISLGLQIDIRGLYAPNNNGALRGAMRLFIQQFQVCIREGKADQHNLSLVLSALVHLNPFHTVHAAEPTFELISDILSSSYPEDVRYLLASGVMELLGKWFDSDDPVIFYLVVDHYWIHPLLDFLSLCEKFHTTETPSHPGLIALRIISASRGHVGFGATIHPILTLALLPTHPLQSRSLALKAFHLFMFKHVQSQMESVLAKDLDKLLRAVGDPFQSIPDEMNYESTMATLVLIEFASSDLWRNHLCHSNFTSFEEIASTEEGREAALECMFKAATGSRSEILHTPARMIAAIRRLEELQCLNTAELVILWTWTVGVVNPADHDAWKLIEQDTLRFYRTHGIGRLTTLSRHIANTTTENMHVDLLVQYYKDTPCRLRPPPVPVVRPWSYPRNYTDLCISRVCQLRRLCYLFGYESPTWEAAVVMEEGEEKTDGLSGPSVLQTSSPFMGWACDYP